MVRRAMPVKPALAILLLALAGCTALQQPQTSLGYVPPGGNPKIVVMRPDVAVDLLTAGGMLERREDWTNAARDNVLASLQALQARRGSKTRVAITRGSASRPSPKRHAAISTAARRRSASSAGGSSASC